MIALRAALRRLLGRPERAIVPSADRWAGIDVEQIDAALQAADPAAAQAMMDRLPAEAWGNAQMHVRRAQIMTLQGRDREAAECYETAIDIDPDNAHALVALGGIARARGAPRVAVDLWRRALTCAPQARGLHYNLACALAEAGDLAAALEHARQAQQEAPGAEAPGLLLGQLHELSGHCGEAAIAYAAVVARHPQLAEAWAGLGRAHRDGADFAAAEAAFAKAGPDWLLDLGLAQFHQRRHADAVASLGRALQIDPGRADARVARANAYIAAGDFANGWREYAARFEITGRNWARPVAKPWSGEAIPGRTLLVDAEQGLGDSIFAARFLSLARARTGRLVLRCPASLVAVMTSSALADQVVADPENVSADAHAYLLSLPELLGVERPSAIRSYLRPSEDACRRWRERLAGEGPAIGMVWGGLPGAPQNRYRVFDPEPLAARLAGRARLFGLQLPDPGTRTCPAGVTDLSPELADFDATAGALTALDLVISAETAVAHLGGALGVRTWVPMPLTADWRWEVAGVPNPWYESVRVFRQSVPMRWDDVFDAIAEAVLLPDAARSR